MCGRETPKKDHICDHAYTKAEAGFVEVLIKFDLKLRTLMFCPSCAKKSYTIEELKTIGNYNQWSY
jgi:hypothetical protein